MIRLHVRAIIAAPPERCFDLARSVDLHQASSHLIGGRAVAGRVRGLAQLGDWTMWSARFFGLRFSLSTEITLFERPTRLEDTLRSGLFAHFGHRYTFTPLSASRTLMTDDFFFQSPLGIIGAAFDWLILRPQMRAAARSRALFIQSVAASGEWRRFLPAEHSP